MESFGRPGIHLERANPGDFQVAPPSSPDYGIEKRRSIGRHGVLICYCLDNLVASLQRFDLFRISPARAYNVDRNFSIERQNVSQFVDIIDS